MSPFEYRPILFLLGLFASLSHLSFGNADTLDEYQKGVLQKGLGEHQKPAEDSAVLARNSSSSRKRHQSKKLLGVSPIQQGHSLPSSSRGDGALLLTSKRQVEDTDLLQCEDNQSLFRIEVATDRNPWETSWELVDVSNGTVVMGYDIFQMKESVYVEEKCLESNLCYQFTIKDST
jgi:hypothetical protein